MNNTLPVTLIIPNNNNNLNLQDLLKSIIFWRKLPAEILISDNSKKKFEVSKEIVRILKKEKIEISVLYKKKNFPGAARNMAIKQAKFSIIVFLDTSTFCSRDWLEITYSMLNKKISVVFGQTNYLAFSYLSKLFRAATFGDKPLKTLPGSAIKKKVFFQTGFFPEDVRAGEDGYFFDKLKKNKINCILTKSQIDYTNNINFNLINNIKKWFRNYYSSASLDHLQIQIVIYLLCSTFFLISFIYSLKGEYEYIKLFLFIYLFIRGVVIPLSKTKENYFFTILNSFFISIISFFLDIAKLLGFLKYLFKKLFN